MQLQARVVELSAEVADKDYEIEFYSNSIEELQGEVLQLKATSASANKQQASMSQTGGISTTAVATDVAIELESWKKKCKVLQLNEAKYLEEIEAIRAQKLAEDKERAVTNILNNRSKDPRPKSAAGVPKTKEQVIAENDGIE